MKTSVRSPVPPTHLYESITDWYTLDLTGALREESLYSECDVSPRLMMFTGTRTNILKTGKIWALKLIYAHIHECIYISMIVTSTFNT